MFASILVLDCSQAQLVRPAFYTGNGKGRLHDTGRVYVQRSIGRDQDQDQDQCGEVVHSSHYIICDIGGTMLRRTLKVHACIKCQYTVTHPITSIQLPSCNTGCAAWR